MFRPYIARKNAIINLKSGKSFKGYIQRVAGAWLVLHHVEELNTRDPLTPYTQPVDGELVVAIADVDFIQLPNA